MLDDKLKLVREAEEEAKRIIARGNKEAERILNKVERLREVETEKTLEEVKQLMTQLEKIKLEEAKAQAEAIKEAGQKDIDQLEAIARPRIKKVSDEIKDIIAQG